MRRSVRRYILFASMTAAVWAVCLTAPPIGGTESTIEGRSGQIWQAVAAELFARPAYAGKKNRKRWRERGRDQDDQPDSFSSSSGSSSSGSSNSKASSSGGGGSPSATSGGGNAGVSGFSSDGKSSTPGKSNSNLGSSADTKADQPDAPAATVQKLIENLGSPAPKRRRATRIEDLHGPDPEFKASGTEILATGLDSAALAKAESLGFKPVTVTSMPGLGINVTKLVGPSSMGRSAARELLRTHVQGGFDDNQSYVIYAPMDAGEKSDPDIGPLAGQRTGQCRDDRCFGRAAICWDDEKVARTRKIKIGIIDTAIDLDHPAFAGRRINVGSFFGSTQRSARDWHGTAVLALLAGDPKSGVPGLAPEAEFFVAETFRTDDEGIATTDSASLLKALEWLQSQDVTLVNMSFSGPKDVLVENAISRMHASGVTFVAAAGNFGPTASPSYPAAYTDVIAVTAVGKDGNNYFNANRGDYVDLSAPGVRIWTALPEKKEGFRTGTSFAAPFVTGILALSHKPVPARRGVGDELRRVKTVDLGPPGYDPIYGRGLAVSQAGCGTGVANVPAPPALTTSSTSSPAPAFGQTLVYPSPNAASAFAP